MVVVFNYGLGKVSGEFKDEYAAQSYIDYLFEWSQKTNQEFDRHFIIPVLEDENGKYFKFREMKYVYNPTTEYFELGQRNGNGKGEPYFMKIQKGKRRFSHKN